MSFFFGPMTEGQDLARSLLQRVGGFLAALPVKNTALLTPDFGPERPKKRIQWNQASLWSYGNCLLIHLFGFRLPIE